MALQQHRERREREGKHGTSMTSWSAAKIHAARTAAPCTAPSVAWILVRFVTAAHCRKGRY